MTGTIDSYGRRINYLRISVTDRCNLRCIYCMPPEGVPHISHNEILSYEEIRAVVQAAAQLGVRGIRLTGGEPLVRADLPELVKMLSQIEGIQELSLTTNGALLKDYAQALKLAGLSRVNVSLDTLRADRFQYITRLGELEDVLAGIEAAKEAGLYPIKTNTVIMRGINDDEILDFARLTYEEGWHVRFIELMPFKGVAQPVPSAEVQQHVSSLSRLELCMSITGNGPAKYYRLAGAEGTIGFISPLTEISFCSRCNRMRLTPDGKLRPCLLGRNEIDLKMPLRNNASMEELKRLILKAVASKPEHHHLKDTNGRPVERKMSQIGG
ncbi:GTP 3',8-cyclase MoaA [Chloroflexota bacterium]